MSDLKYQTLEELRISKWITEERIAGLKSQIAGQTERLKWIDKYIFEKTPQELTINQIEQLLGHKVIIK